MHKLTAALTISAFAFSTGTAAAAEPSPTDQQNAAKLCKQLRRRRHSLARRGIFILKLLYEFKMLYKRMVFA